MAAKELGISASAVSHQIKALEEFIGMPLFIRRNNRLILREEGKAYYDQLCVALDAIENATDNIARSSGRAQVTVNLFPSLADVWLIPRLADFQHRHPDIDVRLNTSELVGDTLNREADFAVVYVHEDEVPEGADVLFADQIVPAASAEYLAGKPPIETPEDLLKHPLIASLSEEEEWKFWFERHGISNHKTARYIDLDLSSSCLKAAKEGMGITMGRRPYLDDDLSSEKLTVLLPDITSTGFCMALITTPKGQGLPYGPRFRNWLVEASRESETVWSEIA